MTFSPWVLLFSSLFGVMAAFFAHSRGKNPYLWFVVGFLFGMLGVVALFLPFTTKRKPVRRQQRPQAPRPPEQRLVGPSNCFWYYLDEQQQQKGPMSFQAITKAWKRGEILPDTFVWHEELPEWKPLQGLITTKE